MREDGVNRLLLVEDNPGDARLLREMFDEQTEAGHNITLTIVQSCREAERCLSAGEADVALLDLGLPDATGLAMNGTDAAIVTAVIGMAQNLKLKVVAEGVETLEELDFLRAHQCDEAQGYYFSKPLPADKFAGLLRHGLATAAASVPIGPLPTFDAAGRRRRHQ